MTGRVGVEIYLSFVFVKCEFTFVMIYVPGNTRSSVTFVAQAMPPTYLNFLWLSFEA